MGVINAVLNLFAMPSAAGCDTPPMSPGLLVVGALLAASPEDALVGQWGPPFPREKEATALHLLELRADGLGWFFFRAGLWSADDKVITLASANGKALRLPYRFKGAKLVVTLDGKEEGPMERAASTPDFTPPRRAAPKRLAHGFVRAGERVFSEVEMPDSGGFLSIGSAALWVEIAGAGSGFVPVARAIGTEGPKVLCVAKDGSTQPRSVVAAGLDGTRLKVIGVDDQGRSYVTDGKGLFCDCARLVRIAAPDAPRADFDAATFKVLPGGLVEDSSGKYGLYEAIHDQPDGAPDVDVRLRKSRKSK